MAFVGKEFEYDLFVSHSHGDPEGEGDSYWLEWSKNFVSELKRQLSAQRAADRSARVDLYFDESDHAEQGLDPLDSLNEQLSEQVRSSAMLLVLLAPQYLDSEWCAREREWWVDEQERRKMGLRKRVALVRVIPTDPPAEGWPIGLADGQGEAWPGFWLFDRKEKSDVVPFGWVEATADFKRAVLGITKSVRAALRDIAADLKRQEQRRKNTGSLGDKGQAIYLHARDNQRPQWEAAAKALEEGGFKVEPKQGPVAKPQSFKERREADRQRVQDIGSCDALLILGTGDTAALSTDVQGVGVVELEEARAHSNRPLPGAILDVVGDAGIDLDDLREEGIDLFLINAANPPWTSAVGEWLAEAATA